MFLCDYICKKKPFIILYLILLFIFTCYCKIINNLSMFIIFCTALAGFWSVNKAYLNLNLNLKNVTCFLYVSVYSLNLFPSHFVSFWFLYLDFSAHSFWCANWKKCLKKAEWKQIDAPQRMNCDHGTNFTKLLNQKSVFHS